MTRIRFQALTVLATPSWERKCNATLRSHRKLLNLNMNVKLSIQSIIGATDRRPGAVRRGPGRPVGRSDSHLCRLLGHAHARWFRCAEQTPGGAATYEYGRHLCNNGAQDYMLDCIAQDQILPAQPWLAFPRLIQRPTSLNKVSGYSGFCSRASRRFRPACGVIWPCRTSLTASVMDRSIRCLRAWRMTSSAVCTDSTT